jgi:hypothetical protein
MGGAGIVGCVSRMRVGCPQKGSVRFLFTSRKNYVLNGLYRACRLRNGCARMLGKYTSIVWDQVGTCRLLAS